MDGLGERIKLAAEQIGGLDRLAPLLSDVSRRTLSDWASDKTEPRATSLIEISRATDVSLNWLLNGGEATFASQGDGSDPVPRPHSPVHIGGMIRLPIYCEVHASAGPGTVSPSEVSEALISFDPRLLRDQGAVPEQCVMIWVKGDSMMPTIPDGAALIVDRSQQEISNGCIMVIGVDEDLLVKRIRRRVDGMIDLISDNPAYPPETLGPDSLRQLRIVGRVVYFCRSP